MMEQGNRMGYKVVLYTALGHKLSLGLGLSGVVYETNVWAVPQENSGPLCVFSNIRSAKKLLKDAGGAWGNPILVFRCEYEPSSMEFVWDGYDILGRRYHIGELSRGTRLAKRVKLIEMVEM